VKTIAVGTGKALVMGEQGEADVLLVHAPSSEKKLVDEGIVTNYQLIMHNDFIIVGPPEDPAGIRGKSDVKEVFQNIAEKEALFVSRGDDSGTHKKELSVWQACNIEPEGAWYQEAGAGMGDTLGIAAEKKCYTLTDRATYLALKENLGLDVLSEGDPLLLNIYHVMQVNEEKFDKVNGEGAKAFVDFWVTDETQNLIGEFGKDKYGEPLFFPDAGRDPAELGL
ncbi:MAG TPA: tungsten ABC transporter substrate-binding protein, partial [Clostridia bacterium]|nr:tungsten ABC transporter substrate-binding protein [Clostridia bacterium]